MAIRKRRVAQKRSYLVILHAAGYGGKSKNICFITFSSVSGLSLTTEKVFTLAI